MLSAMHEDGEYLNCRANVLNVSSILYIFSVHVFDNFRKFEILVPKTGTFGLRTINGKNVPEIRRFCVFEVRKNYGDNCRHVRRLRFVRRVLAKLERTRTARTIFGPIVFALNNYGLPFFVRCTFSVSLKS